MVHSSAPPHNLIQNNALGANILCNKYHNIYLSYTSKTCPGSRFYSRERERTCRKRFKATAYTQSFSTAMYAQCCRIPFCFIKHNCPQFDTKTNNFYDRMNGAVKITDPIPVFPISNIKGGKFQSQYERQNCY